jgi:glucosamine--fructose-6-phosphate aminotransferase (isomerizing)
VSATARRLHPGGCDSQQPDTVVAARRNSPLVVGVGREKTSSHLTSPPSLTHPRSDRAGPRSTGDDHRGQRGDHHLRGSACRGAAVPRDWDLSAAEKGGYDWFMRKEIYEQPRAVADTLLGRTRCEWPADVGRNPDHRRRAATGRQDHSSLPAVRPFYAGLVAKYAIEHWTRIPVRLSWPVSSVTATRSSARPRSS